MSRKNVKDNNVKTIPNAKRKLIIMIVSIVLMVFSATQVYNLTRYTLGLEVSKSDMAVYNFILKLVTYDNGSN